MIKVTAEPWRKLVRVQMKGLLTPAEVEAFVRDFRAAVEGMKLVSNEFSLLVETEGKTVQRQDVMDRFQELITRPALRADRIAIVRDGVLGRMQARRLMEHRSGTAVFDKMEEANEWLRAA